MDTAALSWIRSFLLRCIVVSGLVAVSGCGPAAPPPLPAPPADLEARALDRAAVDRQAYVETGRLDLGTPEADASLGDGWLSAEVLEDGTTFVWAQGGSSSFEVDIVAPRDLRLAARGWPYRGGEGKKQRISVAVNGQEVERFRMPPGLEESSVRLPGDAFRPGRNRITLTPEVIRRSTDGPPISAAWDYFELSETQAGLPSLDGETLRLPLASRQDFFIRLDGAATLAFDALEAPRGAMLRVRVESDDGVSTNVELGPQESPGALDLGTLSGLVRLSLTAAHANRVDAAVILRKPRLAAPLETTAVPAEPWLAEVKRVPLDAGRRPNVLLYVIDTLRADRLGCYGYEPAAGPVSPRIDAFAASGVLFEETNAQSSWTRASMASIVTGYRPSRHGVETRRDALPTQALTLAEMLSANGYRTAGVTTNGNAGAEFGLGQGFDSFELLHGSGPGEPAGVEAVNAAAWKLLDGPLADRERPFFLYLHTMEPHAPYVIRHALPGDLQDLELDPDVVAALAERGVRIGGPLGFGSVLWVQALFHQLLEVNDQTAHELGLAYDASIRHNDEYFGKLLDELERRGALQDTVIVFLSDHGEELYDHGSWSHGMTLYEEQLQVPFILGLPEGGPAGVRSKRPARHVDVLPTLLDYLSLPTPPGLDGESLLAPPREGVAPGFADLDLDGRRATVWIEWPLKLLCVEAKPCELFDLVNDPGEQQDLTSTRPVTAAFLKKILDDQRARAQALDGAEAVLDPEFERQLEALGYI
ncbi:MAG: sulfatase [Acidobacteriota bacterium]